MKNKIKYVRKASSWCVSSWTDTKDKKAKQEQKWFSSEQEAKDYFNKINCSLI